MKQCNIEDCDRRAKARGWCKLHYDRWLAHGDPMGKPRKGVDAVFLSNTEPLCWSGCLIWKGDRYGTGYGRIYSEGKQIPVHRFAWMRERGPIPDGLSVDHICHVPLCVNVDHLRLATPRQNAQNRSGATRGRDLPRNVYRGRRGYQVKIRIDGVSRCFGTYETPDAAAAVAETQRRIAFGEYAGRA